MKSNAVKHGIEKIKTAVVSDEPRKRLLFIFLNSALSLTSFIMTIVNWFTGEYLLLISTLVFSLLCLVNIVLLYVIRMKKTAVYLIFCVEAMILLAFFFISGIPDGFSALWICLIPSFALLIFGIKNGSIFSLFALAMIIFLFWIPAGRSLLLYRYTETFMLRFPFFYCSLYLISLLIEYVRRETQKLLEKSKQEYQYLYRHDALTGLYNRYGIKEFMDTFFQKEYATSTSVILMDIDNFKTINDTYGHEFGDEVLKMVASVPLKKMCEHCRWGGEEFLLIMQCDHDLAAVAEEIRKTIAQTPLQYNGKEVTVTVSVGVAVADSLSEKTIHDVIETADKAMYVSKNNGKNQVTVLR